MHDQNDNRTTAAEPPPAISTARRRNIISEVLIVALGVATAFAVDRLWDWRLEQAREQRYLAALSTDFQTNRANLLTAIDQHRSFVENGQALVSAVWQASNPTPDSIAVLISRTLTGEDARIVSGTYDDLLSSGSIYAISSDTLRKALSTFYTVARVQIDLQESIQLQHYLTRVVPFVEQSISVTDQFPSREFGSWQVPDSPFPPVTASEMRDRAFWNLVNNRMLYAELAIQAYSEALNIGDEILRLVEEEAR